MMNIVQFMERQSGQARFNFLVTWNHILDGLCSVLKRDARVRADAFTEQLTVERFADVLFSLMLSALLRPAPSTTAIDPNNWNWRFPLLPRIIKIPMVMTKIR